MATNSLNIPYIVLSGTILIGIVLTIAVYQPTASETIDLRTQLEEKSMILSDRQAHLQNVQSRVSALNNQREHEERLNVVLPDDDSLEDVLRIMHVAAEESGGQLNNITDQSSSAQSEMSSQRVRGEITDIAQDIVPLAFGVDYVGTYREFRVFLEKLEESPRLMDVVDLSLRKSDAGEIINSSMSVRFYKYNLEVTNI